MLNGYRILDLSDDKGLFCGKLLADMGAEVVKVERPGGDPARMIGPFYQDDPHPGKSLFWFAFCQGKQGVTLNLEEQRGRDLLKNLAAKADAVIESFPIGYLDSIGVGYDALTEVNPTLVYTTVTPFGTTGPYKDYKGPDIVAMAMSGYMSLCGDTDRAPVRDSFPIAYPIAGTEAAAGTVMALFHRGRTGKGQRVDASAQQSSVSLSANAPAFQDINQRRLRRSGQFRGELLAAIPERQVWPCKDGFICFAIYGGATGARVNQALVDWMDSEGMADEFLRGIDWKALDMSTVTREWMEPVEDRLGAFFLTHTKNEMLQGALERRLILLPVYDMTDIINDPQLQSRGYWMDVEHPELGRSITYPGAFIQSRPTPVQPGKRAPMVGEHNREVYGGWLGLTVDEIDALKQQGVI
ncbi:MAG: CoA transferase [Dehalococcoidia bacterium]|nr:CoA transferase [Dehalococcoidia bacterium]